MADGCQLLYRCWNRGRSRRRRAGLDRLFLNRRSRNEENRECAPGGQSGAVVIFAINLWLRFRLPAESNLPLGISIVGVFAIGVGGWLGGEMVYVKGMAVEAVEKLAKKVEKSSGRRAAQ